jgi:hypothetical protein
MLQASAKQYGQKDIADSYAARLRAMGIPTEEEQQNSQRGQQQGQGPTQHQIDSFMQAMQRDSAKAGASATKSGK